MSTSLKEKSQVEVSDVEKHSHSGSVDEKFSVDLQDGDEALRLIGAERTTQFSKEYNEKLKRKLVGCLVKSSIAGH